MMLVVGGTGTLGQEIVKRLVGGGSKVRVLTRDPNRARGLPEAVEVAVGDLRDTASVSTALRGCDAVVAAAHGFIGPGKSSPEAVDRDGNRALIASSVAAGVSRFVLVSVHGARPDHPMSLVRAKHSAEEQLRASGLPFTIVRATPFMETWLSIIGGSLKGSGHALVFGPGTNPINFVSVRDVAAAVVASLATTPANETLELSGPENLGLLALARQIIAASGHDARIKHVPLAALRLMSVLGCLFAPAFARQAQAAVLMNTTDMSVSHEAATRARLAGVPATALIDVLAHASNSG